VISLQCNETQRYVNGSRTVLQADGGILDVKEIENALVANLALRNQAYEAANEGLRGIGRRSWRTVGAKFTRHGCGSGSWFAITVKRTKITMKGNWRKILLGIRVSLCIGLNGFLASCLPRANVAFVKKLWQRSPTQHFDQRDKKRAFLFSHSPFKYKLTTQQNQLDIYGYYYKYSVWVWLLFFSVIKKSFISKLFFFKERRQYLLYWINSLFIIFF